MVTPKDTNNRDKAKEPEARPRGYQLTLRAETIWEAQKTTFLKEIS